MTEQELLRQAKHRLAILLHAEEVSGSVAATCRYYGTSRTRFYRWQRRYEEQGLAGLRDPLEIGVVTDEAGTAVIHAMAARSKFLQGWWTP